MAELGKSSPVQLRRDAPKSPLTGTGERIMKAMSRRRSAIKKLLDHRQSKDDLVKMGIYKQEPVFGNFLDNLTMDEASGIPVFIKLIVEKIETKIDTVGLYRINGDNAAMQKLRLLIDSEDFSTVDNCSDVALLTSLFKLFLREIHEPLIPATVQHKFAEVFKAGNQKPAYAELRKTMETEMPPTELRVLKYLFTHLRRVADEPKNMMNTRNVAVVFAPNILHSAAMGNRRPASLLSEAELHNGIVEEIIEQFTDIFPK